jgi:hypothetical protein
MIIKFNVQEQTLGASCHSVIISRSQDYLRAVFSFSEDWYGTIKIAQFVRGELKYNITLDSTNSCLVPWELLTSQGTFTVTVWANNQPNKPNIIITTNKVSINVFPDGLDDELIPKDPTQGMEGEIVTTCLQAAEEAKNSATASANSASEALEYKDNALASSTSASESALSASDSATIATNKSNEASISATNASNSETNASNSATSASDSASQALGYKNDASASATLAEQYSQSALESANEAAQSASILANTPHFEFDGDELFLVYNS